ncbi:MAG: hypothetical protein ACYCXG_12315 [Acidiferrobacter sp.]
MSLPGKIIGSKQAALNPGDGVLLSQVLYQDVRDPSRFTLSTKKLTPRKGMPMLCYESDAIAELNVSLDDALDWLVNVLGHGAVRDAH